MTWKPLVVKLLKDVARQYAFVGVCNRPVGFSTAWGDLVEKERREAISFLKQNGFVPRAGGNWWRSGSAVFTLVCETAKQQTFVLGGPKRFEDSDFYLKAMRLADE